MGQLFPVQDTIFEDSVGKSILAFMNNDEPEIYLYDIHKKELLKTIRFHKEGPDGVGPKVGGFFMAGFNGGSLKVPWNPSPSQR